jgi:hypothetical protein
MVMTDPSRRGDDEVVARTVSATRQPFGNTIDVGQISASSGWSAGESRRPSSTATASPDRENPSDRADSISTLFRRDRQPATPNRNGGLFRQSLSSGSAEN